MIRGKKEAEQPVERFLKDQVEEQLKGICFKFWPISYSGIPDRIALIPGGHIYFIETKAEGKVPRPLQEVIHKRLRALGFTVLVIDTKEKVTTFINFVKQLIKNDIRSA